MTLFDPNTVNDALLRVLRLPVTRVLEVGCGPKPSKISRQAHEAVVSIDINPRYLVATRECGARVVQGSATALPFDSKSFDGCFCSALLHHLSDDDASRAIAEMLRVLDERGQIVIFEYLLPETFLEGPLAWITCKLDRGRFVRTRGQFLRLVSAQCEIESQSDFFYSWMRLRGMTLRCSARQPNPA